MQNVTLERTVPRGGRVSLQQMLASRGVKFRRLFLRKFVLRFVFSFFQWFRTIINPPSFTIHQFVGYAPAAARTARTAMPMPISLLLSLSRSRSLARPLLLLYLAPHVSSDPLHSHASPSVAISASTLAHILAVSSSVKGRYTILPSLRVNTVNSIFSGVSVVVSIDLLNAWHQCVCACVLCEVSGDVNMHVVVVRKEEDYRDQGWGNSVRVGL